MAGGTAIEADGLTKRYKNVVAVDDLSFRIRGGAVTGFLGPNGAGKTTTLRMVLGLARPTAGHATIEGQRYVELTDPARTVGANLEVAGAHPGRSGRNHLRALAAMAGLPASRVDEVLRMVELDTAADRRAGKYSLGMRQRLGLAATLLGDPRVLVLDEPANGLDPQGIRWLRDFLRSMAAEGRTVLVSSHLMSEMQDTAGHLVVLGRGKVVADTSVADLIASASGDRVTLRTTARTEAMTVLAGSGATVTVNDREALTVAGLPAGRIVALLGEAGVPFSEVSAHRATLEEAYMELTRDSVEFRAPAAFEEAGQ